MTEAKRIVVVGAGGLGCPAIEAVAADSGCTIDIYDDDVVAPENLHRQVLYTEKDIDRYKVEAAVEYVNRRWPQTKIRPFAQRLDLAAAKEAFAGAALVVDCSDSVPSKYAVHDAAFALGVDLVQGAAAGFEATILMLPFATEKKAGADPVRGCLRCLFPDPPPAARATVTCAYVGVLGTSVGIIGYRLALAAQQMLAAPRATNGRRTFIKYDLRTLRRRLVGFDPDPECPLCGKSGGAA